MNKYYAGIGSRETPPDMLKLMGELAAYLSKKDYILRSGGAKGADKAFESGANRKEIFYADDIDEVDNTYDLVKECMPTDRSGFDNWKPYVKGLLARNMMQMMGKDGKTPVEFIICWTKSLFYEDSSAGGTGYAIRCALKQKIPIYNLQNKDVFDACVLSLHLHNDPNEQEKLKKMAESLKSMGLIYDEK